MCTYSHTRRYIYPHIYIYIYTYRYILIDVAFYFVRNSLVALLEALIYMYIHHLQVSSSCNVTHVSVVVSDLGSQQAQGICFDRNRKETNGCRSNLPGCLLPGCNKVV